MRGDLLLWRPTGLGHVLWLPLYGYFGRALSGFQWTVGIRVSSISSSSTPSADVIPEDRTPNNTCNAEELTRDLSYKVT